MERSKVNNDEHKIIKTNPNKNSHAHIKKISLHNKDKSEIVAKDLNEAKENKSSNTQLKKVKEYSYQCDQNSECRPSMEDFSFVSLDLLENKNNLPYFGLYDGFGGSSVVLKVQSDLHKIISKKILNTKENILMEQIFLESFSEIDNEIKHDKSSFQCGTTATVSILKDDNLYLANVGNSTAYLIEDNKKIIKISKDHDCKDTKEILRIKEKGGRILMGRVFGSLSLTRCLGDFDFKDYGVICRPSINKIKLTGKEYTLIIASDGIWDVLTKEDILSYVKENINISSEDLCKRIIKEALIGSRDNVSCIVAKII